MKSSDEFYLWAFGKAEDLLSYFIECLFKTAMKIEGLIQRIHTMKASLTGGQPTLGQYANRLIEFIDAQFIVEAYIRFERLVNAGVALDHAFRIVVSSE